MKMRVMARVSFGCQACGGSTLFAIGAVKTENEKVYLMCQCECEATVPIDLDGIMVKLYEDSPAKQTN